MDPTEASQALLTWQEAAPVLTAFVVFVALYAACGWLLHRRELRMLEAHKQLIELGAKLGRRE